MKLNDDLIAKFCCGCGLCDNFSHGIVDSKGYYRPSNKTLRSGFDFSTCYASQLNSIEPNSYWGHVDKAFLGYSNNEEIRKKASSGGVLTEITRFLLSEGIVDEVLSIRTSDGSFIKTNRVWQTDSNDCVKYSGSKYTASSSLIGFIKHVDFNKKYAVIAKPCDIRVLRTFINKNPEYKDPVRFLFSFFCGGTPSYQANVKLLNRMGLEEKELKSFRYRGNGWPGLTSGTDVSGHTSSIEYETSWGQILGRDIQEICRFCWEGVGEAADISCGDGWYLEGNAPSFEERDGRNIILSRSEAGTKLLSLMQERGVIHLESFSDFESLKKMQPGQFTRKASMFSRVLAMRIMHKDTPNYRLSDLLPYAKDLDLKTNLRMFVGTIKRVLQGKIK